MLLLAVTSCAVYHPTALYASNRPVTQYEIGERVEVKRCTPTLLWLFPLSQGYGMRDLVDDAAEQAGSTVLVEIAVDTSYTWWLIGFTECTRLTAWATGDGDVMAGAEDPAPVARRSSQVAGEASEAASASVSRSALKAAALVYEALDREPPEREEMRVADAKAVQAAAAAGMSIDEIVEACRAGAEELGPNRLLKALLDAGKE